MTSRAERPPIPAFEDVLIKNTGALPQGAIAMIQAQKGIAASLPSKTLPHEAEVSQPPNPYADILEGRPRINPGKVLAQIKVATNFEEEDDSRLRIGKDVIGLIRRIRGQTETYGQKLRQEEEKGHTEAASYGDAVLGGTPFVEASTNWDFFAGTFGVAVGEIISRAAMKAKKERKPLVGVFSSGGARQQENFPALVQMQRLVYFIEKFKREAKRPFISVLNGQVWGGLSASAVPRADIIIGIQGTDYGFTGPRVIQSYTHEEVPPGAQSVEVAVRNRNIDLLAQDEGDVVSWLEKFLQMDDRMSKKRGRSPSAQLLNVGSITSVTQERFSFEKQGFSIPQFTHAEDTKQQIKTPEREEVIFQSDISTDMLPELYRDIRSNPSRPDLAFLLENGFTNVVPLYSREVRDETIRYPAIIAALAMLGDQPFLVVGNQPSYQKFGDTLFKIPSSPQPADFFYLQRILEYGRRAGYPLLCITDTLGAKPTLDAELADQSRRISDSMWAGLSYEHPVISVVIGGLGSGGGMATTPLTDHVAMVYRSMAYVAEPVSATSILTNAANPGSEEVDLTIKTMRPTAQDQKELRLIDAVIPEPEGGAQKDPILATQYVIAHVGKVAYGLLSESARARMKKRDNKMLGLRGFPLVTS